MGKGRFKLTGQFLAHVSSSLLYYVAMRVREILEVWRLLEIFLAFPDKVPLPNKLLVVID